MARKNILLRSKIKKARTLLEANQLSEAARVLEQVIKTDQRDADAWLLLGAIAGRQGHHAKAADYFNKASGIRPDDVQILYNLGIALREGGDTEAALAAFRKVSGIQPGYSNAGACLADACLALGRLDESVLAFRRALEFQPENAELHSNLGSVLQAMGLFDEAVSCYREALRINPNLPVYDSYGSSLIGQGKIDVAVEAFREGLRRQPGNFRVHSNLLLTLNYKMDATPENLYKEHCYWGQRHGNPPGRVKQHENLRDPEKRLRVGYVSPDFRTHSVAYYIEPLLAAHHRDQVEVFCYSLVPRPDETTRRLQGLSDNWREIHGLGDQQIVAQILSDKIDILIDLAGHTAHNVLTSFARKPAPVQVTYLGYPNTTGLPAIDYRLTDAIADPAGTDRFYSEHLERLPDCFLCYRPPMDAPPVTSLPASEKGYITFGSFNNLAKVNPAVIALWSEVVKAVPDSRLLVKNRSLTDPNRRAQIYQMFQSYGVGEGRVELLGHAQMIEDHLANYARVDIGLDTFPYNGTTTTCEALWMGVPVLTLTGNHHAGRVSASLLKCIGLEDCVMDSEIELIAKATALSSDLAGLAALRNGLRDRMVASPLCNSEAFAAKVETAYRGMWRRWCRLIGN